MNKRLKKKLNNTSLELVKAETPKKTWWIKAIALNNVANRNMWNEKNGLKKPSQFSFKLLRAVARRDAIIRICINVIKKTVSQSKWQIKVKDRYKKDKNSEKLYAEEINEVYELFENMNDNDENMRILLDRVIEDILVLDAWAIEVVRSNDWKKITQLNSVDSASIKPLSNKYWLAPWDVAYKQYVAEEVVAEFTRDELLYIMANPSNALEEYGYWLSPIESIMLQVEASMEAEAYNMKTFASDNVPPWLIDLWDVSVEEAEDVMATWNATVIWNTQAMKFMWGSWADRKYTPFQKSNKDMQFSQYIEWLSRIKLATYWLTAQDANIDVDLNRSTAEVHASMSNARWVRSMKRLIEEYFTRGIIRKMGDSDGFKKIEFSFIDIDTLEDMELRAKTDKLNIESWIYAPKYVQERDWYPLETLQTKLIGDTTPSIKPKKAPVKKRTTILNYED